MCAEFRLTACVRLCAVAGIHELNAGGVVAPWEAWVRSDERFLWNSHLLGEFGEARGALPEVDHWVTPVMNGFIECGEVSVGGPGGSLALCLISRRSRHRQGTRFHRRGIDAGNNVANFVETEELLLGGEGGLRSVVQVRGSVPVYWSQEPTLKYTPACALHPGVTEEHVRHCVCV
ncbi:MAG: SAC family polyphosphoinositide phosphatase [Terracidiphilus sp.]|nr:SAC family polyphosphoinositide phosphatase [Terracidiphilus sp.]